MATDLNQLLQQAQAAEHAGKPAQALALYEQILSALPDHLEIGITCGNLCVEIGQFEAGSAHFRRALRQLALQRDARAQHAAEALAYTLNAQGNQEHANGDLPAALAYFEEAAQHAPHSAEYWYNLGNTQRELAQPEKALQSYQSALALNPNDADCHNNLGNVQRELGHLDAAIAAYQKALQIKPDLYHALAHLIHQKQHMCDWQGLDTEIVILREKVRSGEAGRISPFAFLAMPGTTAAEQLQCANLWNAHKPPANKPTNKRGLAHVKKTHIAYLSADFRQHPLALLVTELLAAHDRTSFKISAYVANRPDGSEAETAFKNAVDNWVEISGMTDAQGAQHMADSGVDIMVDLTGFTQHSRSAIAAYRPAKAHINWLGYPGTMGQINGAPLFDYLIADETLITPPDEAHYAEKIIRLPCYQPNNHSRPKEEAGSRADYNLPQDAFVFCCFNQSFKIMPALFAIWLNLLKEIPHSVLWLMDCNPWARANLLTTTQQAGIEASRIIFAARTTIDKHLARHAHADLFLDTLPYNAHTTASDALWAGLPILTCVGDTFASRVAASLLQHHGLPELITHNLQDYAAKAKQLATQPQQMQALKQKLKAQAIWSDLFKPDVFAKALEAEFKRILSD